MREGYFGLVASLVVRSLKEVALDWVSLYMLLSTPPPENDDREEPA